MLTRKELIALTLKVVALLFMSLVLTTFLRICISAKNASPVTIDDGRIEVSHVGPRDTYLCSIGQEGNYVHCPIEAYAKDWIVGVVLIALLSPLVLVNQLSQPKILFSCVLLALALGCLFAELRKRRITINLAWIFCGLITLELVTSFFLV